MMNVEKQERPSCDATNASNARRVARDEIVAHCPHSWVRVALSIQGISHLYILNVVNCNRLNALFMVGRIQQRRTPPRGYCTIEMYTHPMETRIGTPDCADVNVTVDV